MMPGYESFGELAIGEEFDGDSLATEDPLSAVLQDPSAERIFLLDAEPVDPTDGSTVNVRLADKVYRTEPGDADLVNQLFRTRLTVPYNASVAIMDESGALLTTPSQQYGAATIGNGDGELDSLLELSWGERPIQILVGQRDFSYAEFGPVAVVSGESIRGGRGNLVLSYRGLEERLRKPLQVNRYRGWGGCLKFDGVDDYANATITGSPANSMTMECAFRTAATTACVGMSLRNGSGAAGVRSLQPATGTGFSNSTGNCRFVVRNDAATSFEAMIGAGLLVNSRLQLVSGVLDTTAMEIRVYLDGELKATTAVTGTFATTIANLDIGRDGGSASSWYPGAADEMRIWSTARTRDEIRETMGRELLGTETGLVWYNKANDGATTTSTSTVGANLTLTGGPTWDTSYEGGPELSGKRKPLLFGRRRAIDPILVDSLLSIYQVHDGTMNALLYAKDGGVAYTSEGDVADLVTSGPSSGCVKTDLARGYFRLGIPVGDDGVKTADVEGANPSGTWFDSCGDVIEALFTWNGEFDSGDLDAAAVAAAKSSSTAVVGLYTGVEEWTTSEAITEVLKTFGGWQVFSRGGLYRFGRLDAPSTSVMDLWDGVDGEIEEFRPSANPLKNLAIQYRPYDVTLDRQQSGSSLSDAVRHDLSQPYRLVSGPVNETTETRWKNSVDPSIETLFDSEADARAERTRRLALFGIQSDDKPRRLISFRMVKKLSYPLNPPDTVRIYSDRFGLDSGKLMRVVSITERDRGASKLLLWG